MTPPLIRRLALSACVSLTACTAYEPAPLDPEEILAAIDTTRREPDGSPPSGSLTLRRCARWMHAYGPAVQEAMSSYQSAMELAEIPTPLPNPSLSLGPQWGFGDDMDSPRLTPFGSLDIALPLSDRRENLDALRDIKAQEAWTLAQATFRELDLELRRQYTVLAIARDRERLHDEITDASSRTVEIARRLVEAGVATAVDVALFELEHARNLSSRIDVTLERAGAKSDLARQVGVHQEALGSLIEEPLGLLPEEIPPLVELRARMLDENPRLARLRAAYAVAEARLRLECSKQLPDFHLGPSYNRELGEDKSIIGLSLGVELPLFDRNRHGIAEAHAARDAVRVRYEGTLRDSLADLEHAWSRVLAEREKRRLLEQDVAPRAVQSLRIARESLSAATGDAMRLLDAERSLREIQKEALEAKHHERLSWCELESAVGVPLVSYPDEPGADPSLPLEGGRP